ncbi:MAG: c-type cytochrome [Pirellulales bacterium]
MKYVSFLMTVCLFGASVLATVSAIAPASAQAQTSAPQQTDKQSDKQTPASDPALAGSKVLPGLHPLTATQAGEVLIAEFRCAACHERLPPSPVPERTAPDLSSVGSRVTAGFLRKFLESPETTHPGSSMPNMLAARSAAERSRIAEALTHFLLSSTPRDSLASPAAKTKSDATANDSSAPDPNLLTIGKDLFHSVGCVACHGPQDATAVTAPMAKPLDDDDEDLPPSPEKSVRPIAVSLSHVAAKYSVQSLGDFLFQPLMVRSSGRMPDMKLTPTEARAIAHYLFRDASSSSQTQSPASFTLDASLAAEGKKYFQELNCAACHPLTGITPAARIASLRTADLTRGCLSSTDSRSPRFTWSAEQRQAITDALRATPSADSDQVVLAKTLTSLRCIACHLRDNYGGVPEPYQPFFLGSELKLGDDGRIPPPLTLVGAKLRPAWLKKVLLDGESIRTYMATRMPQYGAANLHHFPDLVARLDKLEGPEMKIPSPESRSEREREREKQLRPAGRELLGDKGLNCITCHSFNGKAASLNQGIDLLTSYERLQPQWFYQYLKNPGAFRPRTVMPTAWPNGEATFKNILNGETHSQIEAIWYYLSLGTSAADPPGIRSPSTRLTVDDKARTYRGRSRVAGFRGIAVGYPEKIHYAFNAETGTLTALWLDDFIHVNRGGQGSGDFNPASEPVNLAQDVSFAPLADRDAAWPRLPVMTKEARTNPDPLYPKNVGYQFRGYYLGSSSIPTFLYRSGTIDIEDRCEAQASETTRQLKRQLVLDSPTSQTVWFRALAGNFTRESDRVFQMGRLRLTIPSTEAIVRPSTDGPNRSELLLPLKLTPGKNSLELLYEVVPK